MTKRSPLIKKEKKIRGIKKKYRVFELYLFIWKYLYKK